MVVSVLTLQIMVVSLLVLKRALEPQWFRITAFYVFFFNGFLRLYYGFFTVVFSNLNLVSNPWLSKPLRALA